MKARVRRAAPMASAKPTPLICSLVKKHGPVAVGQSGQRLELFRCGRCSRRANYPDPICPASTTQAVACGEFGGVWIGISGHTWSPGSSDVSPAQASTSVASQFEGLANELPNLIQNNGMKRRSLHRNQRCKSNSRGVRTFDRNSKLLKP